MLDNNSSPPTTNLTATASSTANPRIKVMTGARHDTRAVVTKIILYQSMTSDAESEFIQIH